MASQGYAATRPIAAEAIGTAFLLVAIVGSGVMAERLADGNDGVALLANTAATAAALVALILMFGPISGAHFNPLVTLALAFRGDIVKRAVPGYLAAQVAGALAGVAAAHVMFDLPPFTPSVTERSGVALIFAEVLATGGLVGLVLSVSRSVPRAVPLGVAAWIAGAFWFTSSTSFANPAVALARSLTDTPTGIAPADLPGFVVGEVIGALLAYFLFRWFAAAGENRR